MGEGGLLFLEVGNNSSRVGRFWKAGKLLRVMCRGATESPVDQGLRRSRHKVF